MEKKKKTPEFWRYIAFLIVLFGIFVWLTSGLVNLQLKQSDVFLEKVDETRTKTIALRGKRGNISTSDSVIMAEDELIYNVTFQKDATDNTKALYKQYTASILETIDIIEKNGLAFDELLLEITESAYTENSQQLVDEVKQLRAMGFRIEMDDFGSGYSSLSMLSTLPIDILKLDIQFIRSAFEGSRDTRLIDAVLRLAGVFGLPVVAEGVETAEQVATLRALGCDVTVMTVDGSYGRKGFVTAEIVEEIRKAIARARFREVWGKEMPEGMLSN